MLKSRITYHVVSLAHHADGCAYWHKSQPCDDGADARVLLAAMRTQGEAYLLAITPSGTRVAIGKPVSQ